MRILGTFALGLLAAAGCTDRETPPVAATQPSPPVTPAPPPAPEPAEAEPETPTCDPTGTWKLRLQPARLFCEAMQEEAFELALGFVNRDGRTVLAGAAQAVGPAGEIGAMLPGMRVSLLSGPEPGCAVRLQLAAGPGKRSPHAEIVLHVDRTGLFGIGSRWGSAAKCDDSFTAHGDRTADIPAAWAGLGAPVPPAVPAPPRPAGDALAAAVGDVAARSLLGGAAARGKATPLRGSIVDYVAAVVGQRRDVALVEVTCSEAAGPGGRCVAVVGDPCRPEFTDPESDCEGMSLAVVVDVARGRLDRADAGGYPVESQADIAAWERIAP